MDRQHRATIVELKTEIIELKQKSKKAARDLKTGMEKQANDLRTNCLKQYSMEDSSVMVFEPA